MREAHLIPPISNQGFLLRERAAVLYFLSGTFSLEEGHTFMTLVARVTSSSTVEPRYNEVVSGQLIISLYPIFVITVEVKIGCNRSTVWLGFQPNKNMLTHTFPLVAFQAE